MKEHEMKDRKGFKETRLGWIPEDWGVKNLEQVAKVVMGQSPDSKSYNSIGSGNYLIQGNADIKNRESKPRIWTSKPTKCCEINDILLSVRAPVGTVARSKHNACIGRGISSIKSTEIDHEFLYQFLLNFEKSWKSLEQGSTFTAISTRDIKKLKIPFPKLNEQKTIANCLTAWDTAITKQDALIKAKQQLKKSLMLQLLSGKKRLSGFNGDWTTNRFDYFLNYSPRPVEKPKTAFTKLGIRSHCKGTFQNKNFKPSAIAIDTMYLVKPNDLIVNITFAWEGAVAIVKQDDEGALVSHRFPTYEFIEGISDVGFFKQFIQSKWFRYQLDLISPGGAGRNRVLSKKELNKLKIRLPGYKEQNAIAEVLKTADQEISLLTNQRNQLQLQKKGLMQQLLTGKKRLKL